MRAPGRSLLLLSQLLALILAIMVVKHILGPGLLLLRILVVVGIIAMVLDVKCTTKPVYLLRACVGIFEYVGKREFFLIAEILFQCGAPFLINLR